LAAEGPRLSQWERWLLLPLLLLLLLLLRVA